MKPILISPVNNMNIKKSRQNQPSNEMTLKLVVTPITASQHDSNKSPPVESQQLNLCEFYLGDINVTPQEPTNIKYEFKHFDENSSVQRNLSKTWPITHVEQEQEKNLNTFLHLNIKSLENLLDDIFPKRQYHNGQGLKEHKYDIGANIILPKNNISNDSYEIELAESQPFNILNVPSSVTVKGDGDYERLQKSKEAYQNNVANSHIKVDNISQTVNSLMEREDVECQTSNVTTCTAGTQVHNFNIIDTYNEIDVEQNKTEPATVSEVSSDIEIWHDEPLNKPRPEDYNPDTTMFLERILAQNSLDVRLFWSNEIKTTNRNDELHQNVFGLTYCLTLTLLGDADKGIAVKCMHWNETENHLLAVAYSNLMYTDYTDKQYASVAVWSKKNQHTPERFYEFNTSAITCLKFSTKSPNFLAIGFDCGKILIIDISKKSLEIMFQTSAKPSLETTSISELFWSININKINHEAQSECLIACNTSGCILHYCQTHGKFQEKLFMKLSDRLIQEDYPAKKLDGSKTYKPVFRVTKFIELHQNAELVGTADGLVYSFSYNDLMTPPKKIVSHFGIIKSLEKSPFSNDVYLTTGCDCNINIWVGDIFLEPIITLSTGKQIEKAIWSRTCSTIIASIIDNCIVVWDLSVTKYDPIFVEKMPNPDQKCTGLEFSSDGEHLCVSDTSGKIVVYVLSNISSPVDDKEELINLVYATAKIIHGQKHLPTVLIKERKEYAEAFIKLDYEKYGRKFS